MNDSIAQDSGDIELDAKSLSLRKLVIGAIEGGGRGHLGPALSILEIIRVLYEKVLVNDPSKPNLQHRDRFILSKGHGVLAHYVVLADNGYFPISNLVDFCKFESKLPGHPESGELPGIEFSTGSLGHGLPVSVGIAMAARISGINWRTYVLIGDGEMAEGSIWEAALHASKHKLSNLCVIMDYNKMQASGQISEVLPIEPIIEKWKSFGFEAAEVNGHCMQSMLSVLDFKSTNKGKPRFILAHTIKGKGIQIAENSSEWHHKSKVSKEEIKSLKDSLANK
jgi:transketolase